MGSTAFLLPSLDALRAAGHEIVAVYTRPPKAKGRGQKEQRTPVHERALALGLPVRTPISLKDPAEQAAFAAWRADLAVTGAYGLLLPAKVLAAPRLGCINLHASQLPRWRGAAPIERAILAGDTATGMSLFVMDEGLDTGPVLAERAIAIGPGDDAGSLHEQLAALAATMLPEVVAGYAAGRLVPRPQAAEGACYAAKLGKDEARVDFAAPAEVVARTIRAFRPRPGAWTTLGGARLGLLAGTVVAADGEPGVVVAEPLVVACGKDAIRLDTVRREGGRAMPADAFLRGHPVPPGTRLGGPA
jgi:methionyl-tRNA formyltransferase